MAEFIDERTLIVDGVAFACEFPVRDAGGHLAVMKDRAMVERTMALVERLSPRRILEVGIWRGGSTALLASLARPEQMVAIDLLADRVAALDEHLERIGLADAVQARYGIDQADGPAVRAILDEVFGDAPLDLVIDDGSHIYGPTLATFDVAFPRLRPGGIYVIEDWNGDHLLGDLLEARLDADGQRRPEDAEIWNAIEAGASDPRRGDPPTRLALELVLARASEGDAIRSVSFEANWIVIERGEDAVDGDLGLVGRVRDHHGLLALAPGTARPRPAAAG
ncbi:MAG: class I SAM-dependent methyltransferase [Acidimicrobiales bacterium]|nr:class I SAM-dependent methyltransferase [Acidimicrobiales bacterium]HRW38098.1 class I SAM-dependent methyltransferase [Aquihabitans sp.]